MTKDEFYIKLTELAKLEPFTLLETSKSEIRQKGYMGYCPLCAVAEYVTGTRQDNGYPEKAAAAMGLDWSAARNIAIAADNWSDTTSGTREKLLTAVGLNEKV